MAYIFDTSPKFTRKTAQKNGLVVGNVFHAKIKEINASFKGHECVVT
jgi:hypothetical protein